MVGGNSPFIVIFVGGVLACSPSNYPTNYPTMATTAPLMTHSCSSSWKLKVCVRKWKSSGAEPPSQFPESSTTNSIKAKGDAPAEEVQERLLLPMDPCALRTPRPSLKTHRERLTTASRGEAFCLNVSVCFQDLGMCNFPVSLISKCLIIHLLNWNPLLFRH